MFTHNCEHGWIYGTALRLDDGVLRPADTADDFVQFGPEQLLARLEGEADDDDAYALSAGSVDVVFSARRALAES